MEMINTVLGTPLGVIIYFAYQITNSYGFAILVFAFLVRVILFPVSVFAHKNSIRLLQLAPKLNVLKKYYGGERERLNEERYKLFKELSFPKIENATTLKVID